MLEILDAAIATAAIILGLSLIVQAIQQIMKQLFDLKSAYLRAELLALFTAKNTVRTFTANFKPIGWMSRQADELSRRIVSELEERMTTFGFTDLHLLEDINPARLKELVKELPVGQAGELEEQFNEALKQIDTWLEFSKRAFQEHYERRMKVWAFGISLLVVMVMNADVIGIYKDFASNKTRRDAIVASVPKLLGLAEQQSEDAADSASTKLTVAQTDSIIRSKSALIDSLADDKNLVLFRWDTPTGDPLGGINDFFAALWKNKVGWFGMALLVSLGAPFWYDFLKSVVGLKDRLSHGSTGGETSEHYSPPSRLKLKGKRTKSTGGDR